MGSRGRRRKHIFTSQFWITSDTEQIGQQNIKTSIKHTNIWGNMFCLDRQGQNLCCCRDQRAGRLVDSSAICWPRGKSKWCIVNSILAGIEMQYISLLNYVTLLRSKKSFILIPRSGKQTRKKTPAAAYQSSAVWEKGLLLMTMYNHRTPIIRHLG